MSEVPAGEGIRLITGAAPMVSGSGGPPADHRPRVWLAAKDSGDRVAIYEALERVGGLNVTDVALAGVPDDLAGAVVVMATDEATGASLLVEVAKSGATIVFYAPWANTIAARRALVNDGAYAVGETVKELAEETAGALGLELPE